MKLKCMQTKRIAYEIEGIILRIINLSILSIHIAVNRILAVWSFYLNSYGFFLFILGVYSPLRNIIKISLNT